MFKWDEIKKNAEGLQFLKLRKKGAKHQINNLTQSNILPQVTDCHSLTTYALKARDNKNIYENKAAEMDRDMNLCFK